MQVHRQFCFDMFSVVLSRRAELIIRFRQAKKIRSHFFHLFTVFSLPSCSPILKRALFFTRQLNQVIRAMSRSLSKKTLAFILIILFQIFFVILAARERTPITPKPATRNGNATNPKINSGPELKLTI